MGLAATSVAMSSTFPGDEIIEAIKDWWAEETGTSLGLRDPFAKTKEVGGTVFDVQPTMDSLRAVAVLLTLEEIVPIELPDDIIKLGGYDSLTEMLEHLVPRVGTLWDKYVDKVKT